ncbi:uncharacterized protein LOC110723584 [Chenopodium quinoa]|uniref:uncharacterized protein LOC110723584 n=1 Tax=Chenopodium quinoa TaxID=63459 RepID=UPI000B7732FE|nr:uncharacterized protein LOC110723584 [Chenopodium quinoa]
MSTELVFTIIVKSDSVGDIGVKYNIRESQTFEAVYEDYAVRVDYKNKADLKIKKHNVPIPPCCTPNTAGVVDNDVLIVYGKAPEDNMNVRRKLFWVRDVMTTPRKKMVSAKLVTPLRRRYIMWGATINEDRAKMVVMYENEVLTSIQTVEQAKIKNKYEVFALPVSVVNEDF